MERNCPSSIGSLYQARGVATVKALSPNLRLVHGTMKSPWLDDQTKGLPGISAARVNRSLKYVDELLRAALYAITAL